MDIKKYFKNINSNLQPQAQHAQTEKTLSTTSTEIEIMQDPPEDLENREMAVEVSDEHDDQIEIPSTSKKQKMQSSSDKNLAKRSNLKRLVKYNVQWEKKFHWLNSCQEENAAKCKICNTTLEIGHSAEYDVKKHSKTQQHLKNVNDSAASILSFLSVEKSSDELKMIAAETAFIFHVVKHSQSYNSADCAGKLFSTLFGDSNTAKMYFSVSTDASNKGNIKTLIVRFFDKTLGTKPALLSFYSLEDETSITIAKSLVSKIEFHSLSTEFISSFSECLYRVKKQNVNIVPVGCNCHILSNTLKKGICALKVDVDVIIIKIFNEFSSLTKCTTELKEFFDWLEVEWSETLRHVTTKWLSLYPAIESLIKNFEPLKAYFLSKSNVTHSITRFFEAELSMAYLGFVMNICTIFQPAIKFLEKDSGVILETFDIMENVRQVLNERVENKFFGAIARSTLLKCSNGDAVTRFKIEALNCLRTSIFY